MINSILNNATGQEDEFENVKTLGNLVWKPAAGPEVLQQTPTVMQAADDAKKLHACQPIRNDHIVCVPYESGIKNIPYEIVIFTCLCFDIFIGGMQKRSL